MPLRISQSNPDSLTITVGSIKIQTTDVSVPPTTPTTEGHQRNRTLPSASTSDVLFTGGSIVFPAATGGNITTSAGTWTLALNCPSGQYVKVLIYYVDGNLRFVQGTSNANKDLATLPPVPPTVTTGGIFVAGYVVIHNTAGTIDTVSGEDIFQYSGGHPLIQEASTSASGIVNISSQSFIGIKSFVSGINVDTINENTLNIGVTVEGVLIKDGFVSAASLPKGDEPPAVVSSTSGTAGSADSVSRSDHSHDLGIHSHMDNTSGGVVVPASPTQQGAVTTTSQSFAGIKTFVDTTNSTTKDTGAVVVDGGVGIEKNVYVGGKLNVTTIQSQPLGTSERKQIVTNVASYQNNNSAQVGSYLITLPHAITVTGTHNTFVRLTIKGFDYNLGTETHLVICGYAGSDTAMWNPVSVTEKGRSRRFTTVRLGEDSAGKPVIILGVDATNMRYPSFVVTEAELNWVGAVNLDYSSGWTFTGPFLDAAYTAAGIDIEQTITPTYVVLSTEPNTLSNVLTVSNTTDSTNKDTGAVIVEGGVGIEKNLNVGDNITMTGGKTVATQEHAKAESIKYSIVFG
jgi:hypothetical protein